jgi:hypothetical protein
MNVARTLSVAVVGIGLAASALADSPPRAEIRAMSAAAHKLSSLSDAVHFGPSLPPQAAHAIALRKPSTGGGGRGHGGGGSTWTDPALQTSYTAGFAATLLSSADGIGADGLVPPDANLAVGDTQVVEIVNTAFAVYGKDGALQLGPAPIHALFAGLGGLCETDDGGDPIVFFDQIAHRWFISQLEYNGDFTSNLLCTAVSTSADATGGYVRYEWDFGEDLPDYPKVGVWPDAYYFSANLFWRATLFLGADACALDRNAMIGGLPATGVCFAAPSDASLLPASLDGSTLPDVGEPGFYLALASNGLDLYKFHVDFVTPANSTFVTTTLSNQPVHQACGGGTCVPQPATTTQLDSLGDRLMYRLSYRRFATYESLLVNHSVQVRSSSNQTGVRWYEIRNPNGSPVIYQQSTFAPDATRYRWMGSIAQDKQGNMLLGYSAANATLYPSIAYSGRLVGDPLNQLQTEFVSFFGSGSQTQYNRWGDYTSVAVDPMDDCTFWFVGEYMLTNGAFNWHTRLESLKFPACH